jgi:signal transduction histidine kinase
MLQEALTNIARHAEATEVHISFGVESGNLTLRVRDNGKGFDAASQKKGKTFGLLGIRERAQTLGGTMNFFSPSDGGAVVEVAIPVDPDPRHTRAT